jgi:hypothetical protein
MRVWRCPRRDMYLGRGARNEPMFGCAGCGMDCICLRCAQLCHRGHAIAPCVRPRSVNGGASICRCNMHCAPAEFVHFARECSNLFA